jgi:N-dimethylarginine dimethylaminohydrolase
MVVTAHSEFGKLKQVFLKSPEDAFGGQGTLVKQWKPHNFLSLPDFMQARLEHENFSKILSLAGAEILNFPSDQNVSIDSIYCRDASIQTDQGVIICNMGKALRKMEPSACKKQYEALGMKVLGVIESPGTVEGGDVAWLDQHTLAVAHAYRTNQSGIDQLRQLVKPMGVTVIQVDLPHFRGPGDVFHLMSIISPVDKKLAVVYSPLMPVRFRNFLLDNGFQLIEVPENEFDTLGCNVLSIAPGVCVVEQGNPETIRRMKAAGCQVITFDGSNICVPGGGGPTCLTRPILREI